MAEQIISFESGVDGFPLQGYVWPVQKARAVVVIAHGAAEHALRYRRFAAALNGAGLEVRALDHRGHGASPGPEGLGDFGAGAWDGLVADLAQFIRMARAAHPSLPLVLFAHSMGAAAAQQYVQDHSDEIDALVLSGSTARELPPAGEPPPLSSYNAPFEPARTPYDWLSRDPLEVDRYIEDPLCGFESQAREFPRASARRLADPQRLAAIRGNLPCLLVAGDEDPINFRLAGLRLLERRWRDAGVARIDTRYYPGGRHEMLNETNREAVTADILEWIEARLAELPPLARRPQT
jgi:alpha-beta hydrolase superfamily lysophospholipase